MNSSAQAKPCVRRGNAPVLRISGGSKKYGDSLVLDDVDFEVYAGEVHALLGENGAGKSTLAKIIAGAVRLSAGRLSIDEQAKHFRSPADALDTGVVMVYQETSLVPTMTVAQNLQLGREAWISRASTVNTAAWRALEALNFKLDPRARVAQLSSAQCQMVEIARAVSLNARVIVFDEPTASLSPVERRQFFDLMDKLSARGLGVVFITHALEEALRVSDRITILRNGKRVACAPAAELDRPTLFRLMAGRELLNTHGAKKQAARGEKLLAVENVTGAIVKNMSFSLYAGEVVGLTGPLGSGRSEIAQIVAGVRKRNHRHGGMIYLRDRPVRYRTPAQAIRDGIVYITEDRKTNGFFETMTVDDNLYLASLASGRGWRLLYSRTMRKRISDDWIQKLSINAPDRRLQLSGYSGGNQQKIVIAKALVQQADVLFFDEPMRGVDAGAVSQIHEIIRTLAREGKAVVMISSYLPEILSISDRILVARDGRIVEVFDQAEASEDEIMRAALC